MLYVLTSTVTYVVTDDENTLCNEVNRLLELKSEQLIQGRGITIHSFSIITVLVLCVLFFPPYVIIA